MGRPQNLTQPKAKCTIHTSPMNRPGTAVGWPEWRRAAFSARWLILPGPAGLVYAQRVCVCAGRSPEHPGNSWQSVKGSPWELAYTKYGWHTRVTYVACGESSESEPAYTLFILGLLKMPGHKPLSNVSLGQERGEESPLERSR